MFFCKGKECMKTTGILAALLCLGAMAAGAQSLQDGFYFAQSNFVRGVKDQVVLQVRGGRIVSANWNGITYDLGAPDRKTYALSGKDASGWAEQANKVENFLVATQNTKAKAVDGVTIPIAPFFNLVKAALKSRSVDKGPFQRDGWFYAEGPEDEFHINNTALITIVNGTIVDALWNGALDDPSYDAGQSMQNISRSKWGRGYSMPDSKAAWHTQVDRFVAALVKAGDTSRIAVKRDGKTDAVTGVSIVVKVFVDAADEALREAR
jgi:major membrane immunogen (membrane-anchored lipoprotein)